VKIRKAVPREVWFHVAGTQNPADKLVSLFGGIWFTGPSFLLNDKICYDDTNDYLTVDAKHELKKSHDLQTITTTVQNDEVVGLNETVNFTKYSCLHTLVNVIAYIFRFKNNMLARLHSTNALEGDLTIEETTAALEEIIRGEQREIAKYSKFEKQKVNLNIILDNRGFYRLKSRFGESALSENEVSPLLIREHSHVTKLIITSAHQDIMHFDVETILGKIRESYWIIRRRKLVRNILKKCITCKRFQGKTMSPLESPDLPNFRVNRLTHAFDSTGLDFAGPLIIKGQLSSKVYILLFTCASSRAIHLELTPNMKSAAFIRSFKRFTARRGKPSEIINDNFKTFKSSEVKSYMLKAGVRQRFILPASPWWRGFYARMVRSVRLALKKILRKSFLMFEELQTVLCEVESVINSRPLCYAGDEKVGSTIIPNHLIFGRSLNNAYPTKTPLESK